MKVLAAPGLKCPMEKQPRQYITDTPPAGNAGFDVPDNSVYYQRLLKDGSLVMAPSDKKAKGGNS